MFPYERSVSANLMTVPRGHRAGWTDERRVSVETSLAGTKQEDSVRQVRQREGEMWSHISLCISWCIYRNKFKQQSSPWVLKQKEMVHIFSELMPLCSKAQMRSVRLSDRQRLPLFSSETRACSWLRLELWCRLHHLLRHTPWVLNFVLPPRGRESTCCVDEEKQASGIHVWNWSWVCARVKQGMLSVLSGPRWHRGHRIQNSGGNTNLRLTVDLKESHSASLVHTLCCPLSWCYLTRSARQGNDSFTFRFCFFSPWKRKQTQNATIDLDHKIKHLVPLYPSYSTANKQCLCVFCHLTNLSFTPCLYIVLSSSSC